MTTIYQPPHKVEDNEKLEEIIAALYRGESLPPVVVEPNGFAAITGSHRLAAQESAGVEPDVLILSEDDYEAACEYLGGDSLSAAVDHEERCQAIYETTSDDEIRAAVADQI